MFLKKKPESKSQSHWDAYYKALLKQDFKKALSELNALKEAESKNPQLHIKLGDLLQRLNDAKGAVVEYQQAANLLVAEGFGHKAVAIYKIILRLEPNNEEAVAKTKTLLEDLESSQGARHMETYPAPQARLPESPAAAAEEPAPQGPQGWNTPDESQPAPEWPPASGEAQETAGWSSEQPSNDQWQTSSEAPPDEEWPGLDISELRDESAEADSAPPPSAEAPVSWDNLSAPMPSPAPVRIPEIFSSLGKETAEELLGRAASRSFGGGQPIIVEGDSGDSMFVIKSGKANVILHIMGKTVKLATLSDGDVFGEVAFLTGRPRTASVVADGDLTVLEIDRLLLQDAIERDPSIMEKLMEFYHSRVKDTIRKVREK